MFLCACCISAVILNMLDVFRHKENPTISTIHAYSFPHSSLDHFLLLSLKSQSKFDVNERKIKEGSDDEYCEKGGNKVMTQNWTVIGIGGKSNYRPDSSRTSLRQSEHLRSTHFILLKNLLNKLINIITQNIPFLNKISTQ